MRFRNPLLLHVVNAPNAFYARQNVIRVLYSNHSADAMRRHFGRVNRALLDATRVNHHTAATRLAWRLAEERIKNGAT